MRAILPGRPQPYLQGVSTGLWEGHQIVVYVSGGALVVLAGPNELLQTTYHDDEGGLVAVSIEEGSGKIAACSAHHAYIYRPYGQEEGLLKWSLQCEFPIEGNKSNNSNIAPTLSWGHSDELLVGGSTLALYSTTSGVQLWSKAVSGPVKFAYFSYDASLIASVGVYDRFVKIWRRLSFGTNDYAFDYAYLAHPTTVTNLHWRRPIHREQHIDPVLYTTCADNRIRIFVTGDPHILRLWTQIDLMESIQARKPESPDKQVESSKRYAFVIDSRDFTIATEQAVQQASDELSEKQALDHLIDVANRTPEVCVVLDDKGNMSAWGLETVDSSRDEGRASMSVRQSVDNRPTSRRKNHRDPFNIAHVEGLQFHFAKHPEPLDDNVQFYAFCSDKKNATLAILAHHFDGRLEWLEGRADELFDPTANDRNRLKRRTIWTGHTNAIKKVTRTVSGRAVLSRTQNNESIVWRQRVTDLGMTIHRHSILDVDEHIHRTAVLRDGDFVAHLHHQSISLWDTREPRATLVARMDYKVQGKPLCLLVIPETTQNRNLCHLATISSEMKGVAWEVRLPPGITSSQMLNGDSTPSISNFGTIDLGSGDDLAYVLPVDPAGSDPVISGFLDTFARDIALSYTHSGVLRSWTARVHSDKRELEWLQTSTIDTEVDNPSLVSGSSIRKAALVDHEGETLTIWNTRSTQLEYEQKFENQGVIQDLDWSSTPDNQSILAVGFPHRVVIYTQLRYDYLQHRPAWAPVREISIRDLTPHPIGDSVWLGNGSLVIGAGNQLFVVDENVDVGETLVPDLGQIHRKDVSLDIFSLAKLLNGPLPVYHPQFLTQCILAGKIGIAQHVLVRLFKKLKFFTDGDELDSMLEFLSDEFFEDYENPMSASRKDLTSSYADLSTSDDDVMTVTEEVAASLNELLVKLHVPHLSSQEQFRLADIIECVGTVERHRRSVDEMAARFLVFFRQHVLQTSSRSSAEPLPLSWREIAWAYHSESQDILTDLVTRHFHGKLLWKNARESGIFMWLSDTAAVRAQFETIARNEFTKSDDKDPIDCSLYYLALKKKTVLAGLWRMASWHRESVATQRLLAQNFNEDRWKTAAKKNAFALMGKRRFEYAAAFFLLADAPHDAVSVLATQVGDMQLAIAVARVYEDTPDNTPGPILRQFLKDKVLPHALAEGNRYLATWAFWTLGQRDSAVRALVSPLSEVISYPNDQKSTSRPGTPARSRAVSPLPRARSPLYPHPSSPGSSSSGNPDLRAKLFLTDDPAIVVLYAHLRRKSLQTLRGAMQASRDARNREWDFVLHTARLYGRMGCDVLALDLVRSWEFLGPGPAEVKGSLGESANTGPGITVSGAEDGALVNGMRRLSVNGVGYDPRRLLKRRGSLVVADLPSEDKHRYREMVTSPIMDKFTGGILEEDGLEKSEKDEVKKQEETKGDQEKGTDGQEKKKPPPTQFQEPSADSLLDSFGF